MLTCAFGCINRDNDPPTFRPSCAADCLALGCPDLKFLFDNAFECIVLASRDCGGNMGCIQMECSEEFMACLAVTC